MASVPFLRFTYCRFRKIKIYAQLTASRFFQGRVIMSFHPTQVYHPTTLTTFENTQAVLLQHAFMDPCDGTVVTMEIPFNYYKGYMDLTTDDCLGQLYFTVFNPFTAIVGSPTSITIKLFVSFEGVEFKIPRLGGLSYSTLYNNNQLARSTNGAFSAHKQSGLMAVAGSLLGPIIKKALPDNIIGDLVGGLLDKPQITINPEPITRKEQGYLSHSVNPEPIDKLVLNPSSQQLTDAEHFATSQDEMSIPYLLTKKMSYVGTTSWNSTDPVGQVLFARSIGPMADVTVDTVTRRPTMLDYVSSQFTFWKGSVEFIFDVVSTQYHEGRLDISFHPGVKDPPSLYAEIMSQYVGSFTVRNGQNRFSVRVPYLSDTEWKRVFVGGYLLASNSPIARRYTNYFIGSIQMVVSVPLRSPSSVVPNVQINVFQRAGPDFQLCGPNYYGNCFEIIADNPGLTKAIDIPVKDKTETKEKTKTRNARHVKTPSTDSEFEVYPSSPQSGQMDPTDINVPTSAPTIVLGVDNADSMASSGFHFGETYESFREMGKRYTPLGRYRLELPSDAVQQALVRAGQRPLIRVIPVKNLSLTQSYLGRICPLYRNMRGPICYKARLSTISTLLTTPARIAQHGWISFVPYTSSGEDANNIQQYVSQQFPSANTADFPTSPSMMCAPRTFFSDVQTAEFEVPFYNHTQSALMLGGAEVPNLSQEDFYFGHYLVIALYQDAYPTDTNVYVDIDIAFGDETHFGTFIGLPKWRLKLTGSPSTGCWPNYWAVPADKAKTDNKRPLTGLKKE